MAKPIRYKSVKTEHGWRINIPPKLSESGKRERHFFRTRELADAAGAALKSKVDDFGIQARAISPILAEKATIAAALLAPYGVDILEAAKIVAATREREKASRKLEDAEVSWRDSYKGYARKPRITTRELRPCSSRNLVGACLQRLRRRNFKPRLLRRGLPRQLLLGEFATRKHSGIIQRGRGGVPLRLLKGL